MRRAPAKMVKDATWIRGFMSGRWKMFVAKKPDSRKEIRESEKPRANSKSNPAARTLFTFAVLFSDLYWAVYFIMAEFTPQSLKIVMRLGAIKAIATRPYSGGDRSLATSMTPMADMIVEVANPQKRWNPPLAETLAILIALLIEARSPNRVFHRYRQISLLVI